MTKRMLLAWVLCCSLVHGEDELAQEGEFSIASGDYEVQVSMKYAWTIRKIIFQGQALGRDTGFYGTIFAPESGKFIGAGHTEGGLEKVESFDLRVGKKKVSPKADGRYEGKSVTYEKCSVLDHLRVRVELELTCDGIVMHKTWEALEDQKAKSLYLYQFCWSADTREWIAECADGEIKEGTFLDDKGWRLQSDVKWTAVYDPAIEKGMLMYYPKVILGNMHKSVYWDQPPPRYHKYYLMMDIPALIPKGTKSGPHALIMKGVSAKPDKWKDEGKKIASQLRKNDPKGTDE